jgi:hypothetical protein
MEDRFSKPRQPITGQPSAEPGLPADGLASTPMPSAAGARGLRFLAVTTAAVSFLLTLGFAGWTAIMFAHSRIFLLRHDFGDGYGWLVITALIGSGPGYADSVPPS